MSELSPKTSIRNSALASDVRKRCALPERAPVYVRAAKIGCSPIPKAHLVERPEAFRTSDGLAVGS